MVPTQAAYNCFVRIFSLGPLKKIVSAFYGSNSFLLTYGLKALPPKLPPVFP